MTRAALVLVAVAACHRTPADPERAFWAWFADHARELSQMHDPAAAVARISPELDRVDDSMLVEIGRAGSDSLLVITADGDRSRFAAIQHLVDLRPPSIPGWQVSALRPRDPTRPLPAVMMEGEQIDPARVKVVATPDASKLDVKLFIPGYTDDDKKLGMLAFLLLDEAIGESDTELRVGRIDMAPVEQAPAGATAVDQLPAAIDALPR
jgi:hypothetical protein|nr:hypothetical protein [Kofleriaceae bacterium]